ncbi:helix-turn-helix domain-containing protein [Irregularibacter muris]|uniref:Helix-turn-helix domain-containing protein n=1 Tax=Irregularibacter muris TaxID=1796619 RepID=A0AAE3HFL6_9FIRM|nr:XRE family transcriptional regulator [Irregularibacter muris]MCR1899691.1 helix-turn-helix domain-containing protein [Irregularibacter muris]
MNFSERLRLLRKEKGLSQEKLAELLNVSRQSVSKWESGQSYPEIDKLITLSDLFKITLDDLIKGKKSEDIAGVDDEKEEPLQQIMEEKEEEISQQIIQDNDEGIDEYLMLGGFVIGIAIGLITDNIILGTVGGFLGFGLSYILKGVKGIINKHEIK